MSDHVVVVTCTVHIDVNDPDVIDRCVQNKNDDGVPVPYGTGQAGWRDTLYNLATREDVLKHLAYNAVLNGREDLHYMDGWADLDRDAVEMSINRYDVEFEVIQ